MGVFAPQCRVLLEIGSVFCMVGFREIAWSVFCLSAHFMTTKLPQGFFLLWLIFFVVATAKYLLL